MKFWASKFFFSLAGQILNQTIVEVELQQKGQLYVTSTQTLALLWVLTDCTETIPILFKAYELKKAAYSVKKKKKKQQKVCPCKYSLPLFVP